MVRLTGGHARSLVQPKIFILSLHASTARHAALPAGFIHQGVGTLSTQISYRIPRLFYDSAGSDSKHGSALEPSDKHSDLLFVH
jgi:hypothetical protein